MRRISFGVRAGRALAQGASTERNANSDQHAPTRSNALDAAVDHPSADERAGSTTRRSSDTIRLRALVALALLHACFVFGGCRIPPRADVAPEQSIAEAAGLQTAVSFRVVGPDGGPIDEPERAGSVLTFVEAVQRAVKTDSSLQAALARVRIATAESDQARVLPNPVLSVVLRAGYASPEIEASFVQGFVAALQRPGRASAADDRLRAVAADAVVTALDVIGEVQERYIAAQSSAAILPLLTERLALVVRLVTTARARLDAGEGTRGDVVTLDAQRLELEVAIDRARVEERAHRLRLARSIGEPSSAAAWTLDAWTHPALLARSERAWIETALASRPEIQAVAWRLAALGDEAELSRFSSFDGATAGLDFQHDDGWQVGPAVSSPLPLFDSGDARRARLSAEQLEARHDLTLARRRVVEEVRLAYQALAASTANLTRIQGELIPLQQERRRLAEDAYSAGLTDVTPLFLAEQDLRIAETQAIDVEAKAALALVRLQRAVGGPGIAERLAQIDTTTSDVDRPRLAADPSNSPSKP